MSLWWKMLCADFVLSHLEWSLPCVANTVGCWQAAQVWDIGRGVRLLERSCMICYIGDIVSHGSGCSMWLWRMTALLINAQWRHFEGSVSMMSLLCTCGRHTCYGIYKMWIEIVYIWLKMNLWWKYCSWSLEKRVCHLHDYVQSTENTNESTIIRLTVVSNCEFNIINHWQCFLQKLGLTALSASVSAEVQVPGWGDAPLGAQSSTSGSREKCWNASHEWQEPSCHGGYTWLHTTHTYLPCQGKAHALSLSLSHTQTLLYTNDQCRTVLQQHNTVNCQPCLE